MKKLLDTLASLWVTIALISLLGLIFLGGLWIPQKGIVAADYQQWKANAPSLVAALESVGFTEIYTAPLTVVLWVLFFVNLSLVMWKRIPVVKSRLAIGPDRVQSPETASFPLKKSVPLPVGVTFEQVCAAVKGCGYQLVAVENRFYGVKNRLSSLATLFFHLSFFLMLIGGVVGFYTRFSGELLLAEGEEFRGELDRYSVFKRSKIGAPPDFYVAVRKIVPFIDKGIPTGLTAYLVDGRGGEYAAEINKPYTIGPTTLVILDLRVAPLFVLEDEAGREIDGAFVKLNVMRGKEDVFTLGGYNFLARLYPDHVVEQGVNATRSELVKNPVFSLTVRKGGRVVGSGTVPLGETLVFDGKRLRFREIPYATKFLVVREQGIWLVYAGFIIATAALLVRLLLYRREIVGEVCLAEEGNMLQLAGRSEFYRALALDEFDKTVTTISGKLHG